SREKCPVQRPRATARARSRKTIGIARGIASFEANLMNAIVFALNEKFFIDPAPAVATCIKLHHPTADAVGIKLLVPRSIKRVRKIDSLPVAADLHHLRAARERLIRFLRMRRAIHNSTNAHGAGLFRIEWIRHVVLQKLARSKARNVKKFVVE